MALSRARPNLIRILAISVLLGLGVAACGHTNHKILVEAKVSTIGVNSYLWQASLQTIGFMPITQTDSAAGTILTDWYANPQTPDERVKLSVFVFDRDLRADAIRVNVQRQVRQGGGWVDATVRAGTVEKLEDAILAKARQIRQSTAQN